ncbi:hypothetical protein [Engelhardtia mirabilis]|uniref:Uncharacterized protein n=1 Tax=Engelhardtia mirabilis TaxID=2528011 RepID=A0A518BRR9_9BACT|nr:hypothetical protein Pla133_47930 [Planctomycetes bacterium Pla133]QDV03998.1 hypothetical protein Pla86_47910 [Planctomycetes bacterium Pla86]
MRILIGLIALGTCLTSPFLLLGAATEAAHVDQRQAATERAQDPAPLQSTPSSPALADSPLSGVALFGSDQAELVSMDPEVWFAAMADQDPEVYYFDPAESDDGDMGPPTTVKCGDGMLSYEDWLSYPPVCGATPQAAINKAKASTLQLMMNKFKCEDCLGGYCSIGISTLPGSWVIHPVTPGGGGPWSLCGANEFTTWASYSGPYIVFCSDCPVD